MQIRSTEAQLHYFIIPWPPLMRISVAGTQCTKILVSVQIRTDYPCLEGTVVPPTPFASYDQDILSVRSDRVTCGPRVDHLTGFGPCDLLAL